jgi:hypothetical protein
VTGLGLSSRLSQALNIQDDSKLLSRFPFISHGNPDNNLELLYIYSTRIFQEVTDIIDAEGN